MYLVTFLEGVASFISPCLLPLLPVYVSFFAGMGSGEGKGTMKAVRNALGFIIGFTVVFVALGAFAGLLGGALRRYQAVVNIVTGAIVIIFGLNYLGVLNIGFLNASRSRGKAGRTPGFLSSALFGMVFSIGWTPCVGAFLGSALMLASQRGSSLTGVVLLLCYSLGLGAPFLASALLIDRLNSAFAVIKKHYKIVNDISGAFLLIIGVLMITGLMGRFLAVL